MPIVVEAREAARLVAAGATVLDARGPSYYTGHVPGAAQVSWRIGTAGGTDGSLSDPAGAAAALAALGVDAGRAVLVVGDWDRGWGEEGRIAWDLLYLGHQDVHVLQGGMAAWIGPVQYLPPSVTPGTFIAAPREGLRATAEEIGMMRQGGSGILDVRDPAEYAGATLHGEAWGGHIPGAISVPWRTLLSGEGFYKAGSSFFLDDAESPHGDSVSSLLHAGAVYCTGGVRSALAWVILTDLGYPVAHYDGGWWDWSRRHAPP